MALSLGSVWADVGVVASSFFLVALAEIGDKSQLVCMTLASRYAPLPVTMGAALAFMVLNLLATLFGSALAAWLPVWAVSLAASVLFAAFAFYAWRQAPEDEDAAAASLPLRGKGFFAVLLASLLLIFLAELGDKTQLTVAGLASTQTSVSVWLGASLALTATSAVAAYGGASILQRFSPRLITRSAAALFLLFALITAVHGFHAWRSL